MSKKPNMILLAVDSLAATHMNLYGYPKMTMPFATQLAEEGATFRCFSPSVPTPPGYSSILTGMDCFGTGIVTLRNVPRLPEGVRTLPEMLRDSGYSSTCIGFPDGNFTRGFDNYLSYSGWGGWNQGRSPKAEKMNEVAIPELKRLAGEEKPFLLFLRHMDPHSPYLPPQPFDRIFYGGDEFDPRNESLKKVYEFKPFADYFRTWFPPRCTDAEYIIAQYDGALAYMDACIQVILSVVSDLGIEEETIVMLTADHGETLMDHDCYFDHHGIYECTINVPLIIRYPGKVQAGCFFDDYVQQKDIVPTLLDLAEIKPGDAVDGRSLQPMMEGEWREPEPEMYLTEATWMRKHGWRTPEWKMIETLEPDFHFKPKTELYNLIKDPDEQVNLADSAPEVVTMLRSRMQTHIVRRVKETGRPNPVEISTAWNVTGKPFASSEEAYDALHIGDPEAARKLQEQKKTDE